MNKTFLFPINLFTYVESPPYRLSHNYRDNSKNKRIYSYSFNIAKYTRFNILYIYIYNK